MEEDSKVKLLLHLLLLAGVLAAQDIRVAHVDSKVIFESYTATSKAQTEYDKQVAKWEQKANIMQEELASIKERLDKQALILSDEKKRSLEADYDKKESELKSFIDEIYGKSGKLVKENEKISAPIIKTIRKTINDLAIDEGYDMVLDRASGAVIFWKPEHDLTQKVIDILNNKID